MKALLFIFATIFILGCGQEAVDTGEPQGSGAEQEPVPETGDQGVDSVGEAIVDHDSFETEFDDSELDGLAEELDDLDW